VYAAIRQAKAKTGMAEELARRIKEGAIPIISDVEGFRAYYVVYAPDDTVTAISIFNDYAGAAESNRRVLAWIEQSLTPLLASPGDSGACDRAHLGIVDTIMVKLRGQNVDIRNASASYNVRRPG